MSAPLEQDIAIVAGLDRYQTVTWRLMHDAARGFGLRVQGRVKPYAPPFMMLGVNLENTTSSDFRITATARYLAFDLVGSGSELRVDGTIGSDPGIAIELYRPIGPTPLFVAPYAGVGTTTFNLIEDDAVIARYKQTIARIGLNAGVNLGARSDVRVGAYVGRTTASIEVGDPGFPELRGKETGAELAGEWTRRTARSSRRRMVLQVRLSHIFDGPDMPSVDRRSISTSSLTQLAGVGESLLEHRPAQSRVRRTAGSARHSMSAPLPTNQFALGTPFRLGAYGAGELRGPHYYVVTGGYLRRVGRLPDFMGGPVFAGGWLENGDAFDEWRKPRWRTNGGVGLVMDTIIGPVDCRRLVELRRTLAHLPRCRPHVPMIRREGSGLVFQHCLAC